MIKLQHIEKYYEKEKNKKIHALNNINLEIKQGEIYGVIGKSGAGKSSLIRCVNLLEIPSSGIIEIDGEDLTAMTPHQLRVRRRQMGMIFQHFNLLNSKTVYQNIAFPLQLTGKNRSEIEKLVTPLLELTELLDKKNSYPSQLSGGQKQRVAIARALANRPKILLCDEATSALDPQTTQSILKLLKNINQKFDLTILLITHEMEVVKQICDRVALIDQGKIIENSSVIELFTQPKSKVGQDLIQKTMHQELPLKLRERLLSPEDVLQKKHLKKTEKNALMKICFYGESASEPIISHLVKNIGIEISILQANVEFIQNEPLGIMTVELPAEDKKINAVLDYLKSKNIQNEVIGYV